MMFSSVGLAAARAVDLGPGFADQAQRRGDVVIDAHAGIVCELLANHRHFAVLHKLSGEVLTMPQDASGGGGIRARHQPHQRGLARKGRPQQHIHRDFLQREVGGLDICQPVHHP